MEILETVGEMQARAEELRLSGKKVSVVPTMGALHEGHASLVAAARAASDVVILTVFVNPMQFGPDEDFQRYPRDFTGDKKIARSAGVDIFFAPQVSEMYPDGFLTSIVTDEVAQTFEGKIRPGHFRGVTTVVGKLFHMTKPHIAVFGQKDAQQVFIIQKMVRDLNFDMRIIVAPIVREPNGLARSSRNKYLSEEARGSAASIYKSLMQAAELIGKGERSVEKVRETVRRTLEAASPSQIDYVAVIDPSTFRETGALSGHAVLVAVAARFEETRLIDNIMIPLS